MKPPDVEGGEFLRELSVPTPFDTLLESSLDLTESLTEESQKLDQTTEERAGSPREAQLLMTILGASYFTTLTIYAELGGIDRFDDDQKVQLHRIEPGDP